MKTSRFTRCSHIHTWNTDDALEILIFCHHLLQPPSSLISLFLTWLLQLVATVLCVCVSHDVTLNVPDRFACFNAPLLVVSPVASLSPSSFRAYFLCRAGKEQTPKNVLCYQFNNEWHFCSSSSANACGM